MPGPLKVRKALYVRLQVLITEVKDSVFDCLYSEDDADHVMKELDEIYAQYEQTCKQLEAMYTKWGEVDALAKMKAEVTTAERMIVTAKDSLTDYIKETLPTMKDVETSMHHLGITAMYDEHSMTVREMETSKHEENKTEHEADYIRKELEKLKDREKQLHSTLLQMDKDAGKDEKPDLRRRPEYSEFAFSDKTTDKDPVAVPDLRILSETPTTTKTHPRFVPDTMSTPEHGSRYPDTKYRSSQDDYYLQERRRDDYRDMSQIGMTPPQVERESHYNRYPPPQVGREDNTGLPLPQVEKREEAPLYRTSVHQDHAASVYSPHHVTPIVQQYDGMGQHFKKIPLPKFDGTKAKFADWWQAFQICVDAERMNPVVKLMRLRESLIKPACDILQGLGYSPAAYEVAKERLHKKYGGIRRQLTINMEEVYDFRIVRDGKPEDLEVYAEMLDRLVVNLSDHGRQGELGNGMLYLQLKKKLSEEILRRYERWLFERRYKGDVPALREFVNQEVDFQMHAMETVRGFGSDKKSKKKDDSEKSDKKGSRSLFTEGDKKQKMKKPLVCHFCKKEHGLWQCGLFKQLPFQNREAKIRELQLCERCLSSQHKKDKCYRKRPCTVQGCQGLHHTVLHPCSSDINPAVQHKSPEAKPDLSSQVQPNESQPQQKPDDSSVKNTEESANQTSVKKTMFASGGERLPTGFIGFRVIPVVLVHNGHELRVNALLDDGSSLSYMTEKAAYQLGLEGQEEILNIETIGENVKQEKSMNVTCTIRDDARTFVGIFTAQTLKKITSCISPVDMNEAAKKWNHLRDIVFPEPAGKHVDVLIGNDYLEWKRSYIDVEGKHEQDPIARLTPMGWHCISPVKSKSPCTFLTSIQQQDVTLQALLTKFWDVEDPPRKQQPYTRDEARAMKIAEKTLVYNEKTKRYTIGIPWVEPRPEHGNNYLNAVRSMKVLERRLKKKKLLQPYNLLMREHLTQSYFRKIFLEHPETFEGFFLTHFPVVRDNVETTKIRQVYNGAGKDRGISLNDMILPGPKLQGSQIKILLRFRHRKVAVISDVQRMYLQIMLYEDDQNYHLFVWRDGDEAAPISIYRFERVVFGVNASPFLAQYVCRKHAEKYMEEYPRAVDMILNSTFVDDGLDSVDDDQEAIKLVRDVKFIYGEASMPVHKWLSNSHAVMETIPITERATRVDLTKNELPITQSLGQGWDSQEDEVTFRTAKLQHKIPGTKRCYLKIIATIYDPMGIVSPVTITGKILLQELWLKGLDWDEPIPEDILKKIESWLIHLERLAEYCIRRCLVSHRECLVYIHVFCDASNDAYGAVVYVWTQKPDGEISTNLALSKAKVTPLTTINTPRLELMAAVMGIRLGVEVAESLNVPRDYIRYWSDSMDVLFWVRGHSKDFKPFVASRVGEIQLSSDPDQWHYVNTMENPADLLSRGVKPDDFLSMDLWKQGPEWLRKIPTEWPRVHIPSPKRIPEMKKNAVASFHASLVQSVKPQNEVWNLTELKLAAERFSSLKRYVLVVCYVLRFILKCRRVVSCRGKVGADEYDDTFTMLIKYSQGISYGEEIKALVSKKAISSKSEISSMLPWLDDSGVLRGNTRLAKIVSVPWETRFPILLGKNESFTFLLVRSIHEKRLHAGPNAVLSSLRVTYWIPSARELIRKVEHACAVCIRNKAKPVQPVMAPLPEYRVDNVVATFHHTSVDFAGPFVTKHGRGMSRTKRYLGLFTCLHIRAVHLEMVEGMDTQSFLLCLERMIARKGKPSKIFSDQGTNFVGADNMIKDIINMMDPDGLKQATSDRRITWSFNPPASPHFSGVHEILVKAAKKAIYAILRNEVVTDDILRTVFCQVESLMNSRPITYQSASEKDLPPLTPSHFMIGQMSAGIMPRSLEEVPSNLSERWRVVQDYVTAIWRRWMAEWVADLSPRKKWISRDGDLKKDDLVLLLDRDAPRRTWLTGRILAVFPGPDGIVRVADVLVRGNVYRRPAVKLCPLRF